MDERDKLIGELSQTIEIRTTEQPDGSVQVTLTNDSTVVIAERVIANSVLTLRAFSAKNRV